MDTILDTMDILMIALPITAGGLLLSILWLSQRNPIIAKIGVRNIPRRPTQSVLIVVGLTLSTLIIMSALAIGDTLNYSLRRQAFDAYGEIDELLSTPLLATMTSLSEEESDAQENLEAQLREGGLSSVVNLLDEGLGGINEAQYANLQQAIKAEALVEGVAPAIVFPTIVRNVSNGQSEPLGFIFAVDQEYQNEFGLYTVDGRPAEIAGLRTGVGNVFEFATELFTLADQTTTDLTSRLGFEGAGVSEVAMGMANIGAVISEEGLLDNLDELNIAGFDLSGLNLDDTDAETLANDLFSAVNLNSLGSEVDRVLGQFGLEMRQGDLYLNRVGADLLHAQAGDILEIHIGPVPLPYRVMGIVENAGPLAALAPVVVLPLDEAQRILFMNDRINTVLISNVGDVETGIQHTQAVSQRLRTLMNTEAGVDGRKLELLETLNKENAVKLAQMGGVAFTYVFSLFGAFSIVAAVLLIFMIFVMLAAERRSELGMARAIGMQRHHLIQMFVTEGLIYDLVAAGAGVALGLGISSAMIGLMGDIFSDFTGQQGDLFSFHFRVQPVSTLIAYSLGVVLTFLVVILASWRISRVNIVTAIRDLPDSAAPIKRGSPYQRLWRLLAGPALVAIGAYLLLFSGLTREPLLIRLSTTTIWVGSVLLIGWILDCADMRKRKHYRNRITYSALGSGLLVIWAIPWHVWLGTFSAQILEQNDPMPVLLSLTLSGPLIIFGAILIVMYNSDMWLRGIGHLLGKAPIGRGALVPVLKMAVAYPLNARFRTGMAMLLFAMVICTVTIMAVVIEATQALAAPSAERSAGFDIEASPSFLSFFNPINDLVGAIERQPDFPKADVEQVSRVSSLRVDLQPAGIGQSGLLTKTRITGLDQVYIQQAQQFYTFHLRAQGYADDDAVWQALRERDDVAIVVAGDVTQRDVRAGESRVVVDEGGGATAGSSDGRNLHLSGTEAAGSMAPADLELRFDGIVHTVEVIGVLQRDSTLVGGHIQVNENVIKLLTEKPVLADTFYIKVRPGADSSSVAQIVEKTFVSSGLNATVLAERFAASQQLTQGILRLFQGFLALGLTVGIAALGVISSRTVVERRQQMGMLRAIGFQKSMVSLSLLLEASFIAIMGIGIGAATGLVLGQNIIAQLFTELSPGLTVGPPWVQIGAMLAMAYAFSLVTTILPAYQTTRIFPAEALRYE